MNVKLQSALLYASWGWRVFRLSAYKIPLRGSHGHLDATTDPAVIRSWWDVARPPNLGLACGRPVVLDLDGKWTESIWGQKLSAIAAEHGGLPSTLMAQTARGWHAYYLPPDGTILRTRNEPRQKGSPGVDIKGEGGYVVLPPSVAGKTGFVYRWNNPLKPTIMPQWLSDFCQTIGTDSNILSTPDLALGRKPAYLIRNPVENQLSIAERSANSSKPEWSVEEDLRLRAALAAIPADGYDVWRTVGMALWWLGWERSDGSSISFDLFDTWSQTVPAKYSPQATESKWKSFERNARGMVTIGTVYHLARQHGWNGQAAFAQPKTPNPPAGEEPGGRELLEAPTRDPALGQSTETTSKVNGNHVALPAQLLTPMPIRFQDVNETGFPKATMTNAAAAIKGLRVACSKDLFHEKCFVGGHLIDAWAGELTDDTVLMLRRAVRAVYGFDPGDAHARHGAVQLCLENQYDPLLDYLDGLQWDGVLRIDTWLKDYLGAADTPFIRAVSRLSLIAAVRRARAPGCKFDQIIVLEGEEGKAKSQAIEFLAGADYYSDQQVLGMDERTQQEASVGVWLHELADLKGLRRSEVEAVKAFASRKVDRARPAYGRFRIDRPRRCIYFATTNEDDYLKSDTGNRRFWPVRVGEANLKALLADRDQLWAEAAACEAKSESIMLDRRLWAEARAAQDERLEKEPWTELIAQFVNENSLSDVSLRNVLIDNKYMQMRPEQLNQITLNRAGRALRALGFTKYRASGGARGWRYRRHGEA